MSPPELPAEVRLFETADILSPDFLYSALEAAFNFRKELQDELNRVVGPFEEEIRAEIIVVDETIGRVILYLAGWAGVDQVASMLFARGIISNRSEAIKLILPLYDQEDSERSPEKNIPMIGVVGRIASGKGAIGDIISKKFKSFHFPLSDRLREFAALKGNDLPYSREVLREINDELKPRFGKPVFVRWTMEKARRLAALYDLQTISIDGFRSLEEAMEFKNRGGILIAVKASANVRYQRLLERKRGADDFSREKFDESDALEGAWIDPIMAIADIVIDNEGTEQELESVVLKYLEYLE